MNLRRLIILLCVIAVIFSFNVVSASDSNFNMNITADKLNSVNPEFNEELIIQQTEDVQNNFQNSHDMNLQSSEEYVIYVGTNTTPNGTGTKEDPFATLDLARDDVNTGEAKSKVTVNIDNGTYFIGSYLRFNTGDLTINGTGTNVILKNVYSQSSNAQQSFGLIPTTGNFTMSNIIFNASSYVSESTYNTATGWFTPFVADPDYENSIIFNNCLFIGNNIGAMSVLPHSKYNALDDYIFNNCKFINYTILGNFKNKATGSVRFNYCIFSEFSSGLELTRKTITVTFDSCWLGHNNGYTKTFYAMSTLNENGFNARDVLKNNPFTYRHAILDVSEKYLGNNTYEIVGKLMWNDSTDDNIDKLGSMIVYLSVDNGEIPRTAILENGTFKVNYTAESEYHQITVMLDKQTIKLNNKINFTLDAPTITYGDNQNITVTFPSNVNGTVYVTVNNNTYNKYCDDQNNVTVPIDDILTKGNYPVEVSFAYKNEFDVVDGTDYYTVEEIDSFGFNFTTLSVLGISSSLTASPVTTNYNVTTELVATLTDINGDVLVNKPVHIVVGTIDETLNTTSDGKVSVDVSGLVPNSYVATISFAGDELYEEFSTTTEVVVNKVVPNVVISQEGDLVPGKKLTIKVEIPYATENVTIIVNGDKNTTKLVENTATYTIDELAQGTYYVTVLYAGDELCDFAYATDSFDVVKSTVDLIKDLNGTIDDLAGQLKDAKDNATDLAGQLKDAKDNATDLAGQLKDAKDNATDLAGQLKDAKDNATDLAGQLKDAKDNATDLAGQLKDAKDNALKIVATSLLVENISTTATTAKYFIISLVDANNVPLVNKTIKFTVNGKTDSVVTNGSGVATVKVSYSTAGTRYYTFSFLGETGYSASIASAKVVVSKKATKLTAPKKTFKVNTKTKKVQVKLTSGKTVLKNKKVTLKVKGKTYTAKTNKKGIATFKITKLTKKGTFKYTVKFAGNKAYKAVNKNGKITIK